MPTNAGAGGAHNATAQTDGPGMAGHNALQRAQLLHAEATSALKRVQDKVDKLADHLDGARQSLTDAETAADAAAAHLHDVEGGGH